MTLPLCLITVLAGNRVIGRGNLLIWHLPVDPKHFKTRTLGKPIIMGRRIWDALCHQQPVRSSSGRCEVFDNLDVVLDRMDQWVSEQGVALNSDGVPFLLAFKAQDCLRIAHRARLPLDEPRATLSRFGSAAELPY